MQERVQNEYLAGHLPTRLKGLDEALLGGVPFGAVTELVGPAGIGKTQVMQILLISVATTCNSIYLCFCTVESTKVESRHCVFTFCFFFFFLLKHVWQNRLLKHVFQVKHAFRYNEM
uniref:DNA repair protein RAD51 homolog 4-like n=1 Tax=Nelumbo nucifera TaxID=4432 RepID=A0A822XWM2_NELNU|nr:TPA_asm: hypothetical protein HUJ06_027512 [Nelumbo nucifera]